VFVEESTNPPPIPRRPLATRNIGQLAEVAIAASASADAVVAATIVGPMPYFVEVRPLATDDKVYPPPNMRVT
jgi:hypothetical protein